MGVGDRCNGQLNVGMDLLGKVSASFIIVSRWSLWSQNKSQIQKLYLKSQSISDWMLLMQWRNSYWVKSLLIFRPWQWEIGFIVPGHGLRGRKEWLYSDDVEDVIKVHKGSSVTLWCYNYKKSSWYQVKVSTASNSASKQESRSRSRSLHTTKCSKSKDGSSIP